jgi:hypothetical protein
MGNEWNGRDCDECKIPIFWDSEKQTKWERMWDMDGMKKVKE